MVSKIFIFLILNQSRIFVEPAKIEKFYLKGKTYTEVFTVEVRDFPAHIEIYLEDFDIKEDGKTEFKKGGTYKFSLAPFITISPRSFDLNRGEKREVRVSFNLPDTINSYEKWCMVIFRAYPKRKEIPTVQIVGEIGVPIYAKLKQAPLYADLIEMGNGERDIYFTLLNTSPLHIRARGKIYLLKSNKNANDPDGKVYEKDFSNLVVLPFKKRKYLLKIPENIKGVYRFITEIYYGGSEILKGEKEVILP